MARGPREQDDQGSFWIPTSALPTSASHPFYEQVNRILDGRGFDGFVEELCRKFYHERMGRPSLAPAGYFRLMMIGYFEGLDSERGMACRHLVKDRMERTGMRWCVPGAQAMLDLRAVYLNDDWEMFHSYRIKDERRRLYPYGPLIRRKLRKVA